MAGDDTLRLKVEVDASAALGTMGDFRRALTDTSTAVLNSGTSAREATGADAAWTAQLGQTTAALQANKSSAEQVASATKQAGDAHDVAGPKVQQLAGAFSMVGGALSTTNPQIGSAVSVIGQATGTVTALTGVLGPAGLAIGLLTTAFALYERTADHAADSTRDAASALDDYISKARQATQAAEHLSAIQAGAASSFDTGANVMRLEERRRELRDSLRLDGPSLSLNRVAPGQQEAATRELAQVERDLAQARTANVTAMRTEDEERQRILDRVRAGDAEGGPGRRVDAAGARAAAEAQAETEAEKRKMAARGRRGGGGGTSLAEQEALALNDLEQKREEVAQSQLEREAAEAEAREANLTKQVDAEERADAAWHAQMDARDQRIREAYEIEAQQERDVGQLRHDILEAQERGRQEAHQRQQQQLQQIGAGVQQLGAISTSVFGMIADAQGKGAKAQEEGAKIKAAGSGVGEVFAGIRDDAEAVSMFGSQNYIGGALLLVSSAMHFANAGQMFAYAGSSGGGAAASRGGGGAAMSATSRPSSFDSQSQSTGGGGTSQTVINIGVFPGVDHAATGDAVVAALEAKHRRDGAPIPSRLVGS